MPRIIAELRSAHAFVTNITSRPRSEVLSRIRRKGLEIVPDHVLTAPLATKGYLDRKTTESPPVDADVCPDLVLGSVADPLPML